LNGKQGDVNVCNEFTEEFRTVFQTNTVNSDCMFEEEFWMAVGPPQWLGDLKNSE